MVVFNESIPPNRGLSKGKAAASSVFQAYFGHQFCLTPRNLLSIFIPVWIASSDSNVCRCVYVHADPLRAPPRSIVAAKRATITYARDATLPGSSCAQLDKALRARLLAIPHSAVERPNNRSNGRRAPCRDPLRTGATSRRGSPARRNARSLGKIDSN